ncbi:MAG: NUDIX hydrolase [Pseudomonadota bacterium]
MNTRWKPHVTVAAVIEKDGHFLLVEEETTDGLRLNNPAGHLDCGETPLRACARETLEETAYSFVPNAVVGIYLARQRTPDGGDTTYLRFAFCGELGICDPTRALDAGIVRTLWMTADEIRTSTARHRSPLVLQCVEDYLRGLRYPLELVYCDPSVTSSTELL